jgi:ubiquinone/menaquinone biosynthesis C-methylase UbiE
MRGVVLKNYFDEDLAAAVSRYGQSDEFAKVVSLLGARLRPGALLLDFGAGRGLTSLALAETGAFVVSLESDPSEVVGIGALGKFKRPPGLPLAPVSGDVLRLPFPDQVFDIAFCRSVLHHIEDLDHGLQEIWRVMRPGGTLVVLNEHILRPFSDERVFLQSHPAVPYGVNEHAYPVWRYWKLVHKTGFRKLKFFGYDGDALKFQEFLASSVRHNPLRGRLMALPGIGSVLSRALYGLHVLTRRHMRYIFVPEESCAAISWVAHKPQTQR